MYNPCLITILSNYLVTCSIFGLIFSILYGWKGNGLFLLSIDIEKNAPDWTLNIFFTCFHLIIGKETAKNDMNAMNILIIKINLK